MKQEITLLFGALWFVVLIAGLTISGCEQTNELKAVDFNTDLNFSVPVSELTNGTNISYDQSLILDATTNPEIKEYADRIRDIKVLSMEFAIENYTTMIPDEIYLNNAVFGFGAKTSTTPQSSCNVDALPVTHWADTGFFQFDSCNSTFNAVGDFLTSEQAVKFYIKGTFTKAPVSFVLIVRMNVRVTATAL